MYVLSWRHTLTPSHPHTLTPSQESLEGVSVVEVSGQDLCLTWTQPDSLHWTFHISSSVSHTHTTTSHTHTHTHTHTTRTGIFVVCVNVHQLCTLDSLNRTEVFVSWRSDVWHEKISYLEDEYS